MLDETQISQENAVASIVAGLAASHTPTIGFARDTKAPDDPAWGDVFRVFDPLNSWLIDN